MSKINFEKFDILNALKKLSIKRKLFHCEADFQFELAWTIKEMYDVNIRMEYPYTKEENNSLKRNYIDILVIDKKLKNAIPIELKYKTKKEKGHIEGKEKYNLTQQSAHNDNRYYIYQDIERIQHLVKSSVNNNAKNFNIAKGYVVFLTNDEAYIKNKRNKNTTDEKFEVAAKKSYEQIKKEITHKNNGDIIDKVFEVDDFQNNLKYKDKGILKLVEKPAGKWYKYSEYDNKFVYQLVFTITNN